jgi:hypothetical protein
MRLMLNAMTAEDHTKAEAWFNCLGPVEAKVVLRALAGRYR